MSMRDQKKRMDLLSEDNRSCSCCDNPTYEIEASDLAELIDIADERDTLEKKLTMEENATQEWRVIAEGRERAVVAERAMNEGLQAELKVRLDQIDKLLAVNGELKAELERLRGEKKEAIQYFIARINKYDEELERLRQAVLGREEIKNLTAKLAEAHELFTLNVNELNAQICAKDRELERLRKAVPGDVEKAINRYFQSAIYGAQFGDYSRSQADENALLAIIGALVERRREEIQEYQKGYEALGNSLRISNEQIRILRGFLDSAGLSYRDGKPLEGAKAYANKIIGGEDGDTNV